MAALSAYQPAEMTLSRESAVTGVGLRMIDLTVLPPGVLKSVGLLPAAGATDESTLIETSEIFLPWQSWSAAWPAALPSSVPFFQTSTYCLPTATLCRLAGSPAWPLAGGDPEV